MYKKMAERGIIIDIFVGMKRILTTGLLALAAGALAMASTMHEPHQLTSLWKQFEQARLDDLPQKEAEILTKIKQEAGQKRYAADFYVAATEYVNVVQRRDWKQRDALRSQLRKEIEEYNEPIVTFLWMDEWNGSSTDQLWSYVKKNPDGFQGLNRSFHNNIETYLGGTLRPFIQNDKEYVLWRMFKSRYYQKAQDDEIYQALEQELQGRYPGAAALELYVLDHRYWSEPYKAQERAAYTALADKYAGKAASLYPRAHLLSMELIALNKSKAQEQAYKDLYLRVLGFEKEREAYKGDEAVVAKGCKGGLSLTKTLTEEDLEVEIDTDGIHVVFQNLPSAQLTLRDYDDNTLKTWNLENPKKRFYLKDTLVVSMPKLADGDYSVEAVNGKISDQAPYTQYTLSIATRFDGRGRCVYVTDYKSGQPLERVTLRLLKGDKEQAKSALALDGFTPIPDALDRILENPSGYNSSYKLEAVSGDRRSMPVGMGERYHSYSNYGNRVRCNIYMDQGAYRPGETARFKAVVYEGDPARDLHVCVGKEVEVNLYDSEDNLLETKKLKTNEYGSVWGEYVLPEGLRNGRFRLEVKNLASQSFPVDEYVLPSFDLEWDKIEQVYFTGDTLPVSGELVSYSGHNLSGAHLNLTVSHYGTEVYQEEKDTEGRRFGFEVPVKVEGWYYAELTVTDLTGETRSFGRHYYVGNRLDVEAIVEDGVDAELVFTDDPEPVYWRGRDPRVVVRSTQVRVTLVGKDGSGNKVPLTVHYRVLDIAGEKVYLEGDAPSGQTVTLQLPQSGLYQLESTVSAVRAASGETIKGKSMLKLLCTQPADKKLPKQVDKLFLGGDDVIAQGKGISAVLGSGNKPVWAVVTLYGEERKVLETKKVKLAANSVMPLELSYKDSYPDAVRLVVFYFLNGRSQRYERVYRREKDRYSLPLQFSRFTSDARPGTEYTFTLQSVTGTEAVAAIWDKSLDAIAYNNWPLVHFRDVSVDDVFIYASCGRVGSILDENIYYSGARMLGRSNDAMPEVMASAVRKESEEMVMADTKADSDDAAGAAEQVKVRSDFATALAFLPALQPAADGTLSVNFRTADKLSTYYVRVYAHDPAMHNALVEKEMVVSLPVQVQLLEPRFLYEGDVWEAAVSVSSIAPVPVSGRIVLQVGDTQQQLPVTVPAGEGLSHRFLVTIPSCHSERSEESLLVTASFLADGFSDAVQVTVPVLPAAQQLTEAHSAVLRAGMDREALLADLRSRFVNVPASAASLKEISVLDMVRDAIPSHVEPSSNDVLSLSEAWYVGQMASRLIPGDSSDIPGEDLLDKILACQNQDGGFGWFEGMKSTPMITAVLLERFAKLRDRGFEVPDMADAVAYLDKEQFDTVRASWYGGITDAQYLHVRALYAGEPFEVNPVSEEGKKRMESFRKWVKDYLAPSSKAGRGLQGQILPKARRVLTLQNLLTRDGGTALAKAWGVKLSTRCRLTSSLKKDVASLVEYAVEHRDGGWYYPNAVMPWRGLLETEAYAHSLLCDLLTSRGENTIADGIRLWLMLQKETQKWEAEPAFIDAITSILDGSQAVLDTRVVVLSARYQAPFKDVKASGNGFTVERRFFRDGVQLQPGDSVKVGDRIVAEYHIWNAENRSFVRLTAGREAALSPEQQLSGFVWGGGYREVKANRTAYFFDSYPEENTQLTETFFVTQAGTFQAPVVVIESLYAPHYRANDGWKGALSVGTGE